MIGSDRAPIALLGALVGGILLGEQITPSSGTAPLVVSAALMGFVVLVRGPSRRFVLLLVAFGLLGAGLAQRAHDALSSSPLAPAIVDRADATIDAVLVDDPDGSRFTTRALVRVERMRTDNGHWQEGGGSRVVVVADADAAPRLGLLDGGDRVTLGGWLRPLEPYDERERWRHAVGRFDAQVLTSFVGPRAATMKAANALRGLVLRGNRSLPPTERALVSGFLLGDTRAMPDDVLEQFRSAGLSHLLAVSGANVAFTLGLLGPILRRLPRAPRLAATVVALLLFGAMTRWEPSVLRACAMAACAAFATHVGRPARATRVLAIAVMALVVLDPFLVHSIGFQLSCGASAGIAVLGGPIRARLRGPEWLRESLATTAAAQLGVMPVLLPVFGSMPLVALPANLLAVPIAGPLTMWGLAGGALAGVLQPIAPALTTILHAPTRLMADAMVGIAGAAARVPLAIDVPLVLAVTATTALVVLARGGRMLRRDALVVPPR